MKDKAACPYCGKLLDVQAPLGKNQGAKPFPGAISCCIGCERVSVFTDNMDLREITDADRVRLKEKTGMDDVEYAAKLVVRMVKRLAGK